MSNNIDPTSRTGFFSRLLRTDEAEEKEAPPESLFRAKAAGDSFELMGLDAQVNDDDDVQSAEKEAAIILSNGPDFRDKLHEASQNQNLEEGQFDMAALEQLAQGTGVFSDATFEQMDAAQYYLNNPDQLNMIDGLDGTVDGIFSYDHMRTPESIAPGLDKYK
jgi:hypothetical protein